MFSWLSSNQLSGTIPDSIGDLVELDQLYVPLSFHLSYQQFFFLTSVHDFLHNFSFINLMYSDLYSNQLSGAIPETIGNLAKIQGLYVLLSFRVLKSQQLFISPLFFHDLHHNSFLLTFSSAGCFPIS